MIVFLDFDGVLRRESAPKYRLEPDLLRNFERFVSELEKDHGAIEIVITSTWRTAFSLGELRDHLGPKLEMKVVGTTPTLNITQDTQHPRHLEVRGYLMKHGLEDEEWIVIDDQGSLYPPGLDNLILCDPEHGFQHVE